MFLQNTIRGIYGIELYTFFKYFFYIFPMNFKFHIRKFMSMDIDSIGSTQ